MQSVQDLGTAVIVSGPSGSGKSTIVHDYLKDHPSIHFSVSCTTRAPRDGEVDGRDYFFVSQDDFKTWVGEGRFIEYASVHGNCYGTLKSEVLHYVTSGTDVILDIDVQGAMQIRQACERDELLKKCCEFVFIAPPSLEELEKRLRARATDAEESILRRLGNARGELEYISDYSYLILNDELGKACADFRALFTAFGLSTKRHGGPFNEEK